MGLLSADINPPTYEQNAGEATLKTLRSAAGFSNPLKHCAVITVLTDVSHVSCRCWTAHYSSLSFINKYKQAHALLLVPRLYSPACATSPFFHMMMMIIDAPGTLSLFLFVSVFIYSDSTQWKDF